MKVDSELVLVPRRAKKSEVIPFSNPLMAVKVQVNAQLLLLLCAAGSRSVASFRPNALQKTVWVNLEKAVAV